MRETLEATKRRLGLNRPPGDGQGTDKPRDPVRELEDEIAQEEDFEKRRALSLKLKEQRLERELRVRDLQDRLRGTREGGNVTDEGAPQGQEEKTLHQREKVMTQAKALLDSGVEPQQVGAMLLGLPAVGAAAGQGMTVADALKIVDMVVERKKEGELRGTIERLEKQVENLSQEIKAGPKAQLPANPAEGLRQQAQAFKGLIDALKEVGVPIGESGGAGTGKTVEQMKEEHRHAETMEKIKGDNKYHEEIVTLAGDTVERVGRGMAHQFLEQGEGESAEREPAGGGELESFTCTKEDCGQQIFSPPGATHMTCPKCKEVYTRKKKE